MVEQVANDAWEDGMRQGEGVQLRIKGGGGVNVFRRVRKSGVKSDPRQSDETEMWVGLYARLRRPIDGRIFPGGRV